MGAKRFRLLTPYEHPLVDSLWVLAHDSFPRIPVERVNRILGREPGAPINVRFGHFSGYMGAAGRQGRVRPCLVQPVGGR